MNLTDLASTTYFASLRKHAGLYNVRLIFPTTPTKSGCVMDLTNAVLAEVIKSAKRAIEQWEK